MSCQFIIFLRLKRLKKKTCKYILGFILCCGLIQMHPLPLSLNWRNRMIYFILLWLVYQYFCNISFSYSRIQNCLVQAWIDNLNTRLLTLNVTFCSSPTYHHPISFFPSSTQLWDQIMLKYTQYLILMLN